MHTPNNWQRSDQSYVAFVFVAFVDSIYESLVVAPYHTSLSSLTSLFSTAPGKNHLARQGGVF